MLKFSPSYLGIISESDNIFQIFFRGQFGVFWQFQIFFRGYSEYSDNSDFFSEVNSDSSKLFFEVIRSIRTIPNFFMEFQTDFRIICRKCMEIHQNPLFFHENIFFLIRKSLNTPNSIFRPNIRNLLLRVGATLSLYMCCLHPAAREIMKHHQLICLSSTRYIYSSPGIHWVTHDTAWQIYWINFMQ